MSVINRPAGASSGGRSGAAGGAGGGQTRQPSGQSAPEFVRGVVLELKRVTWPSREEWISATILTIALVVGIGLFTFLVDWLLTQVFAKIHP